MKILASNFSPATISNESFTNRWDFLVSNSNKIRIAVAYTSNESILYLRKLLQLNPHLEIKLTIGMAYFDGLTKDQFEALEVLNAEMFQRNSTEILIVRSFPFHGKVYEFESATIGKRSIIGSSNLSNILPIRGVTSRNYEIDFEISDVENLNSVADMLDSIETNCSVPFSLVSNQLRIREQANTVLDSRQDIEKLDKSEMDLLKSNLKINKFDIPLKDAPKSNLNVYFGEGRVNQQGFVKPRHWYEVEIIVDLATQRSASNYPANIDFIACTDDGYKFTMRTSGDFGKNLRSKDDLTILGRWIKGRMEVAGALKSGEVVTADTLQKYGRSSITFTETNLKESDPNSDDLLDVWFIDFGTI